LSAGAAADDEVKALTRRTIDLADQLQGHGPAGWDGFNDEMRDSAMELASALESRSGVAASAQRLRTSCIQCHQAFRAANPVGQAAGLPGVVGQAAALPGHVEKAVSLPVRMAQAGDRSAGQRPAPHGILMVSAFDLPGMPSRRLAV
jgi:hypothetical protein